MSHLAFWSMNTRVRGGAEKPSGLTSVTLWQVCFRQLTILARGRAITDRRSDDLRGTAHLTSFLPFQKTPPKMA